MAYSNEIFRIANERLEAIRQKNREELKRRKEEVFEKVPGYRESKNELVSLLDLTMKMLGNKEAIEQLKENISDNMDSAEALLLENGYPGDYLNEIFDCPECKDTGYIMNKKCHCFEELLKDAAREKSNLNYVMETKNAENFDLSIFSDEKIDGDISPRENMRDIYAEIKYFIRNFDSPETKSLCFFGATGLGKTFAASITANELLNRGYSVLYQSASKFFEIFEDYKFNRRDSFYDLESVINDIYDVDLLIIDDLGSEFSTNYTVSALFEVVNKRLINNKKMIITTNLDIVGLNENYTGRIASRISGDFEILEFLGDDVRLRNLN